MNDFRKINFGQVAAEAEGQENPTLLLDGYYDKDNIIETAINSSKFLFLGYKGSGKTALSEHLRLMKRDDLIIDQLLLESFPYKSFTKMVSGSDDSEVKIKVAWNWLLKIKVLGSLISDKDAKSLLEVELNKAIELFTQLGIFPLTNISSLVKKSSSNSFKTGIKIFSYEHTNETENASISFELALDYISNLVLSFKEEKRHLIIIDGIDDILTSGETQYKSIAGLVNVVKNINKDFVQNALLVKIIILCRTDIFERLPDPNKNKIRSDFSFTFNWYVEGSDNQERCGLIDIANLRTQLVYPNVKNVFKSFFPNTIEGKDTKQYLLDMTRHTPRDFMRLMFYIQSECKEKVRSEDIKKALSKYSSDYFIPEIRDEMTGYIPYKTVDTVIKLLASFRNREIRFRDFKDEFEASPDLKGNLTAEYTLNVLYECSAIGNIYEYDDNGTQRITFKYRNRNSSFNRRNGIILHRGLWKGLNINY